MAHTNTARSNDSNDNEPEARVDGPQIILTRVVKAPRALVFQAFTDPAHVVHWYSPFGFKNTIHEMTVKPGSTWRFTMHGPDGTDYQNLVKYEKVEPPSRLVFRHGSGIAGEPDFAAEVTFEEVAGGTRVTLQQTHASPEVAAEIAKYAIDGGKQTLTRLAGYLEAMRERTPAAVLEGLGDSTGAEDYIFLRVFDAPRALVFRVLTEGEHLMKWFSPPGMSTRIISSDLRPGGSLHYAMKAGQNEMFGRFVYREVKPPERLAYVVSFTDEKFQPVRHPGSATWPLEVLAIATLTELGGKTLLVGRSIPIHASAGDRQTFLAGHASMDGGFKGTYDSLDAYLKTVAA